MMTPQQNVLLLMCVVALVLLSPGAAWAYTPETASLAAPAISVWNWLQSLFSDQQRMIQIGAIVLLIAVFLLVRK